jgi:nucleoside-diphosphate-sugar epimerase
MHGKYVIVIRSAGFIGSSLIKTLTKDNDVIRANLLAMDKNITGVFNITSGRDISANELV